MQVKKVQRKPVRRVAVVRSLAEVRALLGDAPEGPVVLVSTPDAAATLGVGFFWALVEEARAAYPALRVDAVMDCGDAPGYALAALRMGFRTIVLRGDPRARARVAAIARAMGARLLARPPRR